MAYILMGSGGVAVHLASFHLGNLFPAWRYVYQRYNRPLVKLILSDRSVIINLFSGIFNASCINFVFILVSQLSSFND